MDIFQLSEKLMGMDDETWARHANPFSVYSWFTCLPLIALAIWSRMWFGWWCLVPLILALVWTWINPRIATKPASHGSWAYRGVMGERLLLNRKSKPIPGHHQQMAYLLTAASVVGMLVLGYGLYQLSGWATLCGLLMTIGAKLWFVDRMAWLYQDMREVSLAD